MTFKHGSQFPGQIMDICDARVSAHTTPRGHLVGCISSEKHALLLERVSNAHCSLPRQNAQYMDFDLRQTNGYTNNFSAALRQEIFRSLTLLWVVHQMKHPAV